MQQNRTSIFYISKYTNASFRAIKCFTNARIKYKNKSPTEGWMEATGFLTKETKKRLQK